MLKKIKTRTKSDFLKHNWQDSCDLVNFASKSSNVLWKKNQARENSNSNVYAGYIAGLNDLSTSRFLWNQDSSGSEH